ncbi:hypothetical protein Ccrd_025580 [Cynara cardunculus var. scolymus]|uniref:Peptidase S9 prolyl oligopeptidase catalytic domain-containing protein n=1 Tax=Cynara cardunculus var. scolymus TaxID=59895 RepID=A0A124S5T8_CYNCS|nr:hypothetical protein Ccrd_025580 [Cynara cardunculus var. scolymus]
MPFIFDTVWDLVKLADYLTGRDDIDHSRIGITGESLGGMHAWFAAFVDTRYSVVVPIIGVQVWNRIAPGLTSEFDSVHTVPLIAPRPLLILNGEEDPRCPIAGLDVTISRTCKAFQDANCPDSFKVIAEAGIGHEMTGSMVKEAMNWFDKFFQP